MSLLEEEVGAESERPRVNDTATAPPPALIHVTALTRPFSFDRQRLEILDRPTITELLERAGIPRSQPVIVYIDDDLVYPAFYHVVRPKPGSEVLVRVVARGSSGAGKAGGSLSIVLGVILIIIGIVSTPIGWGLIAAGVLLVVSGVLALVIPPPTAPRLRQLSSIASNEAESPTLSISGGHNNARPYGVVPSLLGTHRTFPPYGAFAFTEQIGADEYVRMLFIPSIGECETEDYKIGETPIANFTGIEMEVRTGAAGEPPLTLYTNKVFEDSLSIVLLFGVGQIRTSSAAVSELSAAFTFPQGLAQFGVQGGKSPATVQLIVDYRLVGQTTFVPIPGGTLIVTDTREQPTRAGVRWIPVRPAGPYGASAWAHLGLASFDGSKVNDGILNVAAFNVDTSPAGSYLEVDTGIPGADFGRVLVTTGAISAADNATWDVQYSDDRVQWTTVFTGLHTGLTSPLAAEWANPGVHRYWRLLKTNGAVAGPGYYEVEFWVRTIGQYDVRVTRNTADSVDPLLRDIAVWSALRSIGAGPPVTLPGVALIAMRIKATDQLNGIVDTFNCIAHRKLLDYATYAGTVKSERPIAYWRLGEIVGATIAFDASGNSHSGTYHGAPTLGAAGLLTGDADTAMSCDGADDSVDAFSGMSQIDMGGMSFTIEAVVKPQTVAAENRGIVHKGDGLEFAASHLGWSLIRATNHFRFVRAFGSASPTVLQSSTTLSAGATYHVVVTYNLATGQGIMWVNGSVADTQSIGTTRYADSFGVEIAQASDSRWQGTVDEISIFPGVLSDARIAAHYAAFQGTREWIVQRTSNPASLYRHVLQGTARPVADARLDLPQFQAWHQENDVAGRSCNLIVDFKTGARDLLQDIAACGRATPTMNDLKYATVRDLPQATPVQHLSPRNTRNYKGRLVMPDRPHALKIRFIDPTSGWQQAERIVYDDGYSADGVVPGTVAATRFEVMEFVGLTDPDLAFKLGRYHLASMRLRPEAHDIETDIEHLACRRGDLVMWSNDVTQQGIKWGRVKSIATSGSNLTGFTLDESLVMDALKTYGVRFRLADGTSRVAMLVTAAGEQTTFTLAAALVPPIPAIGDLALLGVNNAEAVRCIVQQIMPRNDLGAVLTLVDEAPAVHNADQGSIPPWDPQITIPAPDEQIPPTPSIDAVISDETVLIRDLDGSLTSRIVVQLHYTATSNVKADFLEARWRRHDATSPYDSLPPLPADSPTVAFVGVEDGVAYDLRLRTVNREGPTSPWAEVLNHVVIGKSSPPAAPTNLRLELGYLRWDYATPPLDLAGFVIRRAPGASGSFPSGLQMHVGIISGSPFPIGTIYNQWTFMVAAIDTSGNFSAPAMVTVDFGDPLLHNVVESYDYKANTFPGTITNGSVIATNLVADQLTTGFWTQDSNLFWSASGATLFWQGTYKQLTYVFTFTPAAGSAGARIVIKSTVVASGWSLEWKKGSLEYAAFPGVLEGIEAVAHTFRLKTDASVVQGVVSALTLYVDALDIQEKHVFVATAVTTGTRLTLKNTYRAIKTVQPTVVANGGETATSAIAADKQNTAGANNGPLIKSFDQAGAVVAGHVDVDLVGY